MNGIIITSTNKTDLKLFIDLANRIGVSFKTLSDDDIIDMGLLGAMEEGKKTKFVPKEKIMKKLKKK
ncbi:MAG TPA: hypothetical protein PLS84_03245 [Salinivirgaceae bacterium]|nr:hypothetical protein [Salinivirgaceae bacterium]